jgi:hypothetical protein
MATTTTTTTTTSDLKISYLVKDQWVTDSTVNEWELRASRRALLNLKTLLYQQPMLDLLRPQIEDADAYYRSLVAASEGKYRECRTDLKVRGLTMAQVMGSRQRWLQMSPEEMAKRKILPAHPEHYTIPIPADIHHQGEEGIVEVIGGRMARVRLLPPLQMTDIPPWVMDFGDPAYPRKKSTIGKLADGTVLFYILHEFRDTEVGCDLILRLLFPAAAPQVMFDEHAEHLAVEFRSFLRMAAEEMNEMEEK